MGNSINDAIIAGAQTLGAAAVPEPRLEASSLLAFVLNRNRTFVITHAHDQLTAKQLQTFHGLIVRRAIGEPLQYITGKQEFFVLEFEVTPDVLIPRPETEILVEASLDLLRQTIGPVIADIGTGSGCIAISLLHELSNATAVGTDASAAALRVAARNAARHGVDNRLALIESDCFSALRADEQFSLIASNPPYIAESEREHLQREVRREPDAALFAGPDGLAIVRRLLRDSPAHLLTGGYLLFEIGFDQSERVIELIDDHKWKLLEIRKDLQQIPRTVVLQRK